MSSVIRESACSWFTLLAILLSSFTYISTILNYLLFYDAFAYISVFSHVFLQNNVAISHYVAVVIFCFFLIMFYRIFVFFTGYHLYY